MKRDRKNILRQVKELVMSSPKSMYEISKEMKSNWDTIKSNVALLTDLGVVKQENGKVIYSPSGKEYDEDSIAGIPISKKVKEKVWTIAKTILAEWRKHTDEPLNSTKLQKMLVELSDGFPSLELPTGWYRYGKVVLVRVSGKEMDGKAPKKLSEISSESAKILRRIEQLVPDYINKQTSEIVDQQYEKYKTEYYMLRKKIEKMLCEKINDLTRISKELYELVFLFPLDEKNSLSVETFNFVKGALITIIQNISKSNKDEESLRMELLDVFNSLWNVIATYNLFSTIEGSTGYDDVLIKSFIESRVQTCKDEFIDKFQEVGYIYSES